MFGEGFIDLSEDSENDFGALLSFASSEKEKPRTSSSTNVVGGDAVPKPGLMRSPNVIQPSYQVQKPPPSMTSQPMSVRQPPPRSHPPIPMRGMMNHGSTPQHVKSPMYFPTAQSITGKINQPLRQMNNNSLGQIQRGSIPNRTTRVNNPNLHVGGFPNNRMNSGGKSPSVTSRGPTSQEEQQRRIQALLQQYQMRQQQQRQQQQLQQQLNQQPQPMNISRHSPQRQPPRPQQQQQQQRKMHKYAPMPYKRSVKKYDCTARVNPSHKWPKVYNKISATLTVYNASLWKVFDVSKAHLYVMEATTDRIHVYLGKKQYVGYIVISQCHFLHKLLMKKKVSLKLSVLSSSRGEIELAIYFPKSVFLKIDIIEDFYTKEPPSFDLVLESMFGMFRHFGDGEDKEERDEKKEGDKGQGGGDTNNETNKKEKNNVKEEEEEGEDDNKMKDEDEGKTGMKKEEEKEKENPTILLPSAVKKEPPLPPIPPPPPPPQQQQQKQQQQQPPPPPPPPQQQQQSFLNTQSRRPFQKPAPLIVKKVEEKKIEDILRSPDTPSTPMTMMDEDEDEDDSSDSDSDGFGDLSGLGKSMDDEDDDDEDDDEEEDFFSEKRPRDELDTPTTPSTKYRRFNKSRTGDISLSKPKTDDEGLLDDENLDDEDDIEDLLIDDDPNDVSSSMKTEEDNNSQRVQKLYDIISEALNEFDEDEEEEEVPTKIDFSIGDDEEYEFRHVNFKNPQGTCVELRPYQQTALKWLLEREREGRKVETTPSLHSLFLRRKFKDDSLFYICPKLRLMTLDFVPEQPDPKGGILADEMGLGKTVEMITLMCSNPPKPGTPHHLTLVVCPLMIVEQWRREIEEKTRPSLRVYCYQGTGRTRSAARLESSYDVLVSTYQTVAHEYKELMSSKIKKRPTPLFQLQFFRLILDEAHNIKNRKAQQSLACISLRSQRRWCLTGTPIQNSINDLFSLFAFLRVNPHGQWPWWNKNIGKPFERQEEKAVKALEQIIQRLLLRRTKQRRVDGKVILQLPEKCVLTKKLKFRKAEMFFYKLLYQYTKTRFKSYMSEGSIMSNMANILELLLHLRQVCCHPALVVNSFQKKKKERRAGLKHFLTRYLNDHGNLYTHIVPFLKEVLEKVNKEDAEAEKREKSQASSTSSSTSSSSSRNIFSMNSSSGGGRSNISNNNNNNKNNAMVDEGGVKKKKKKRKKKKIPRLRSSMSSTNWKPSVKIDSLIKYLYNIRKEDGGKSVVFSQWTSMLDLVEIALENAKIKYVRVDGSMSRKDRDVALQNFKKDPQIELVAISLKVGGLGLNLTWASYVFLLDLWWNPAVEEQAIDRVHRIGQTKNVTVVRFVVEGTVEEKIMELQKEKSDLARSALGDTQDDLHLEDDDRIASKLGLSKEELKVKKLQELKKIFGEGEEVSNKDKEYQEEEEEEEEEEDDGDW